MPEIAKHLKIIRKNPDNIRAVAANDFVVVHSAKELFLTFSLVEPPVILDEAEFNEAQNVEAFATAKLIISLEFAEAVVKTLSTNIENFKREVGG